MTVAERPTEPLHRRLGVTDDELDAIRAALKTERAIDRIYQIQLVDDDGVVHAEVEKVIHIRPKRRSPAASP